MLRKHGRLDSEECDDNFKADDTGIKAALPARASGAIGLRSCSNRGSRRAYIGIVCAFSGVPTTVEGGILETQEDGDST